MNLVEVPFIYLLTNAEFLDTSIYSSRVTIDGGGEFVLGNGSLMPCDWEKFNWSRHTWVTSWIARYCDEFKAIRL